MASPILQKHRKQEMEHVHISSLLLQNIKFEQKHLSSKQAKKRAAPPDDAVFLTGVAGGDDNEEGGCEDEENDASECGNSLLSVVEVVEAVVERNRKNSVLNILNGTTGLTNSNTDFLSRTPNPKVSQSAPAHDTLDSMLSPMQQLQNTVSNIDLLKAKLGYGNIHTDT